MFSQFFIVKAFIVGFFVAVSTALLGTILVLKHYSLIGDGLSHVSFSAYTIALSLNLIPVIFAFPIVILTSFFLLWISESGKIKSDAALAIISNSFLSIGVVVVSVTSGMNINIWSFMFGSVLAISDFDLFLSVIFSIFVVLVFVIFYNKFFIIIFDENFAKVLGIKLSFYNFLIAVLISIIVVVGTKIVGALLMSSLIVFPTLTSMRIFKKFKLVAVSSVFVSVFCFIFGLLISYIFSWPTGATVVLMNLFLFCVFSLISFLHKS